MKASELRIGNLFDYHGQTVHVMDIVTSVAYQPKVAFGYFIDSLGFERFLHDPDCPKEIPLTEEWLLKFGFTKKENSALQMAKEWELVLDIDGENRNTVHAISGSSGVWAVALTNGYWSSNNVANVHQLQNLYFALTGEELKA